MLKQVSLRRLRLSIYYVCNYSNLSVAKVARILHYLLLRIIIITNAATIYYEYVYLFFYRYFDTVDEI